METTDVLARLAEAGTPPEPESALQISVGLDDTIARFRNETLPFIARGGAELQFVFAPYGRGKTHFLRTLQEVARREGFATSYVDCRSNQAPFESLRDTYRVIAGNLRPAGSARGLSHRSGLEAILEESLALRVGADDACRKIAAVQHASYLATDFRNLVVWYGRNVLSNVDTLLEQNLGALLRSDMSTRCRITDLYERYPLLPRPLGKLGRRNAASWLRSLGSLPQALGYPGLVILFDETERMQSLHERNARQRQVRLANVRNVVDHIAVGNFRACAIYHAVVEEFLETARLELGALSQRIERVQLSGKEHARNPRAVWVNVDELTDPTPPSEAFYKELGQRIARLGVDAGMLPEGRETVTRKLEGESTRSAASINVGAVREFVKRAATIVSQEIGRDA